MVPKSQSILKTMFISRVQVVSKGFRLQLLDRLFRTPTNLTYLCTSSTLLDRCRPSNVSTFLGETKEFSGFIPVKELDITHCMSSGPGGQNVNKVFTKVDIRFKVESASWLTAEMKSKIISKLARNITKEGFLVVKSERTRSQTINQADALRKLREILWQALKNEEVILDEEEMARINKCKLRAARERVREKRERSRLKRDRQNPDW